MKDKPVYSTAKPLKTQAPGGAPARDGAYQPSSGPMKLRLETKGRGGKAVTVIFNLCFATEAEAVAVMKELQSSLGSGATFKNSAIELRGDLRTKVEAYFAKKSLKIVRAGG